MYVMAKKLSKKQTAYIHNRARGLSQRESAIMADYTERDASVVIETSPTVQQELARIRAETAENCGITKEDVVQMLVDAAGMAKMSADATGLVAAARELGKMLGFYAPEVKKTLVGVDKAEVKKIIEQMGDEELLKLAHARPIDGSFTRVPEQKLLEVSSDKAAE
jgi:hypothetical protein